MTEWLSRVFTLALRVRQEVEVAWEVAKAEVVPLGATPGLCGCGFALDDHIDGECPEDDEDVWALVDDDLDEDEDD